MAQQTQPQGSLTSQPKQPAAPNKLSHFFSQFANHTSRISGAPNTFAVAVGVILLWAITGPMFKFSDTWQLVINTGTTIITFLMVFLIQNTQNRDSAALHLKIDELIRVNRGAHNALIDMEDMTQEELDDFKGKFANLARHDRETGHEHLQDFITEVIQQTEICPQDPQKPGSAHASQPSAYRPEGKTEENKNA